MKHNAVYTADEAVTKWCPFVHSTHTDLRQGFHPDERPLRTNAPCISHKCMAWRWHTTHIKNPGDGELIESSDTYGYCGLAGEP